MASKELSRPSLITYLVLAACGKQYRTWADHRKKGGPDPKNRELDLAKIAKDIQPHLGWKHPCSASDVLPHAKYLSRTELLCHRERKSEDLDRPIFTFPQKGDDLFSRLNSQNGKLLSMLTKGNKQYWTAIVTLAVFRAEGGKVTPGTTIYGLTPSQFDKGVALIRKGFIVSTPSKQETIKGTVMKTEGTYHLDKNLLYSTNPPVALPDIQNSPQPKQSSPSNDEVLYKPLGTLLRHLKILDDITPELIQMGSDDSEFTRNQIHWFIRNLEKQLKARQKKREEAEQRQKRQAEIDKEIERLQKEKQALLAGELQKAQKAD